MKILLLLSLLTATTHAKVVEYVENAYAQQASQEIIDKAEQVAQLLNFTTAYEVIVPKKAGLQINPWTKFIGSGINPQTKNPFIFVNPILFSTLPQEQQTFLLVRSFIMLKESRQFLHIIPYLFIVLTFLLGFLILWGLKKTELAKQKLWVRILLTFSILTVGNLLLFNKLQAKLIHYCARQYDYTINRLALEKTLDKDAAIKALESLDTAIKNELKNGDTFWAPYATMFENYAKQLQK